MRENGRRGGGSEGLNGELRRPGRSPEPVTGRDRDVVGRRVAAFLVDNAIAVTLVALAVSPPVFLMAALAPEVPGVWWALFSVIGVLLLVALVFGGFIGYYALLEGYRGQTPGKMLLGIEVIREDTGAVPGPKASALRALLLVLADGQFFGAVGLASILATGKKQRIGDMVARTLVVRKT